MLEIDFDRRKESRTCNDCLVSIDDTDFCILQKVARGNKFASCKYGGKSALRYELGLDIFRGNLIWIEGPYTTGKYPDITIFRCPNSTTLRADHHEMIWRVSARHKTINARLKYWGIMAQVYHHDIENHGYVFWVVAVITHLTVENKKPLFEVYY